MKQVQKSHYEFQSYMSKGRWSSLWHQLNEVLNLSPQRTLEIGPGSGIFKVVAKKYGINVETLDIDAELSPDHLSPADNMPFKDNSFDVVCAFQMLEHVPYELSLRIFKEMSRVCGDAIVVSLPDARAIWPFSLHIPKIGVCNFLVPNPLFKPPEHIFDGQHYWELNKVGYDEDAVISDFERVSEKSIVKKFRVLDHHYHHFLVFRSR